MPDHDPDVRRLSAVRAGCISAAAKSQQDHNAAMAKAREAQRQALIRQADPDGSLAATDPAELDRRVNLLRRAKLAEMALKSAAARRARKREEADRQAAEELDILAAAEAGAA